MDGRIASSSATSYPNRKRPPAHVVALLLMLGCCVFGTWPPRPSVPPSIAEALDRSMRWLEANPADPGADEVGVFTFDAMTWFVLAEFHPDEGRRLDAGGQLDRRLRAMPRRPRCITRGGS